MYFSWTENVQKTRVIRARWPRPGHQCIFEVALQVEQSRINAMLLMLCIHDDIWIGWAVEVSWCALIPRQLFNYTGDPDVIHAWLLHNRVLTFLVQEEQLQALSPLQRRIFIQAQGLPNHVAQGRANADSVSVAPFVFYFQSRYRCTILWKTLKKNCINWTVISGRIQNRKNVPVLWLEINAIIFL